MTPERRLEIEQLANLYGPPNCWTGTTGTLAAAIRELIIELEIVKEQVAELEIKQAEQRRSCSEPANRN